MMWTCFYEFLLLWHIYWLKRVHLNLLVIIVHLLKVLTLLFWQQSTCQKNMWFWDVCIKTLISSKNTVNALLSTATFQWICLNLSSAAAIDLFQVMFADWWILHRVPKTTATGQLIVFSINSHTSSIFTSHCTPDGEAAKWFSQKISY